MSSRPHPGVAAIRVSLLVLAVAAVPGAPAHAALPVAREPALRAPGPLGARGLDGARRIDANRINLFTTNIGSFAYDIRNQDAGLFWPRGTTQRAVFASGLWLGGLIGGQVHVTVAEYGQEYQPGPIVGGLPADPDHPDHIVYKVVRWTGNPADSEHVDRSPAELAADPLLDPLLHHSWAEYRAGAATHGAPMRLHRLPVTSTPDPSDSVDVPGPDVQGDMMLWCVYNDAEAARHTVDAGGTAPLGVEVQQSLIAFDRPDDLGDVVYLRFVIANKGTNTVEDFHVSLWNDPDLGSFSDDLVGCDPPRGLGFAYNARSSDPIYGSPPPAMGLVLLRGPAFTPGQPPLGMSAFTKYIGGTDPTSAQESLNFMHGLRANGSVQLDPVTGLPTTHWVSGDPVTSTGWLDTTVTEQRMHVSSGPGTIAPGDALEVWAAIVMGRGMDRLASVATVQCVTDLARAAFEQGFALPTQDVSCSTATAAAVASCPRPADFWASECAAGGTELSAAQLDQVAAAVDARSSYFDWGADPRAALCATLDPGDSPDVRMQARREFAAFLANYSGNEVALPVTPPNRIFLYHDAPVACPPLAATDIRELAATSPSGIGLLSANYLNHEPVHRRALGGVDSGLPFFDLGAGLGSDFLGSSLNATDHADSFRTVEIRFDTQSPQKCHRLLRMEKADGSIPANVGPGFLYGGFFNCPFQVWDVAHDVQLDAIFVERYLVLDDDGTPSPDTVSIPTLDRRWAPSSDLMGGHEFLMVLNRPYRGTPRLDVRTPGALLSGQLPVLYALNSRLRTPDDVIDDGDAFRFEWGRPPSPGVDRLMVDLEQVPLDSPEVLQQYQQIVDCLSAINSGVGIGAVCASLPVFELGSLVEALAEHDRVTLRWRSDAVASATVERRESGREWRALGRITADASHELLYLDQDVVAGASYDYCLSVQMQGGTRFFGEGRVRLPLQPGFALRGSRFDAREGRLVVRLSLANRAPARLDVMDVAGRRMLTRDLSGLAPGEQVLILDESVRLPSGIYLLRLEQSGREATGKAAVIR